MQISLIIRTFNEERYLGELIEAIKNQEIATDQSLEIIVVDSGSTDGTRAIADQHGCKIEPIDRDEFTFGRSLNIGCRAASGSYLVFISGHCIPASRNWLSKMLEPLVQDKADYLYGSQSGRDTTKFSERRVFEKYFPVESKIPQSSYFLNNANSAMRRSVWESFKFDEEITGLEDMHLAKRIQTEGLRIGYVSDASVFHIHDESWSQVKWRYEREAIALREISPELHMSMVDLCRCIVESIYHDAVKAWELNRFWREIASIVLFRSNQYYGSYRGSHENRKLSAQRKKQFFYPKEAIESDFNQRNRKPAVSVQQKSEKTGDHQISGGEFRPYETNESARTGNE